MDGAVGHGESGAGAGGRCQGGWRCRSTAGSGLQSSGAGSGRSAGTDAGGSAGQLLDVLPLLLPLLRLLYLLLLLYCCY